MRVLGIETSCDETGVAVYDGDRGLLADLLYSQVNLHADYGGVVPELASRDHIRKLMPMVQKALDESGTVGRHLDGIAYTAGPGLIGALLVGAAVARSLGWAWQIPTIGVHHMEAHLLATMLSPMAPAYPFVALLVSGGHTQLVEVEGFSRYRMLGESVDDAAGEAFDKTAKMLGLGYPGGPAVAKAAEQGRADRFRFPRPMTDRPGMDFSFSGLKTHTLNTVTAVAQERKLAVQDIADIARAFEEAVIDTLTIKCRRALEATGLDTLVIAGGVSANLRLRASLEELASEHHLRLYCPELRYCTDNGAMIAYAGHEHLATGEVDELTIEVRPRWPLAELGALRESD